MSKIYPFKFLDSYSKEDTKLFFGRNEEIEQMYQMIFQTNILMVYGASGTGKTSLIQCGLAGRFQSHDWLSIFIRRGSNINTSFNHALKANGAEADTTDLAEAFREIYMASFRPVYLIFDQFEELFIIGDKAEQVQFLQTIKHILALEQPVKMIFSIREEYLGHLYDFEKELPQLMRKKIRVEPMNLEKVKQVLTGAAELKDSIIHLKKGQEQELVQAIFERVKGNSKSSTIQLPYLQVFLDKLYMATTNDESRTADATFTMETINKIGDIGDILRDFLEEQAMVISRKLSNKGLSINPDMVWDILSPFVTLEGTKAPIAMSKLLARLSDIDTKTVKETVEEFVNSRILRYTEEGNIYELAHDSLAKKIAGKRSDEEIALLEVERLIKSQVALKKKDRALLPENQISIIDLYEKKLYQLLNEEDIAFIEDSRNSLNAAKERELAEIKAQEAKKWKGLKRTIAILIVVALTLGVLMYVAVTQKLEAMRQSKEAQQKTLSAQSLALSSQAFTEIYKNSDITMAFRYAQYALEKDSTNLIAMMAIYYSVFQPKDAPLKLFYNSLKTGNPEQSKASISPDGNKVAFFNMDSTIHIHNLLSDKHLVITDDSLRILRRGNFYAPSTSYFSPKNKLVDVVLYSTGNKLYHTVYDAVSGKKLLNIVKEPGVRQSFSPDEKTFIISEETSVEVYDLYSGKKAHTLSFPADASLDRDFVFSKDGKHLIVHYFANDHNSIKLYNTDTWEELKECTVSSADSIYYSFSNDSRHLGIKCGNTPVTIYDLTNMSKVDIAGVDKSTFSSKRVIINKNGSALVIYDFITGGHVLISAPKQERTKGGAKVGFVSAQLSPDGQRLITCGGQKNGWDVFGVEAYPLTIWDANNGNRITTVNGKEGTDYFQKKAINTFSLDGKYLLTSCEDKLAMLYDLTTGKQKALLAQPVMFISAQFSDDSKYIVSSSKDSFIKKWPLDGVSDRSYCHNNVGTLKKTDLSDNVGKLIRISKAPYGQNFTLDNSIYEEQLPGNVTVTLPGSAKLKVTPISITLSDSLTGNSTTLTLNSSVNALYSLRTSPDKKYLLGDLGHWKRIQGANGYFFEFVSSVLWDIKNCSIVASLDVNEGLFSPDTRYIIAKAYNKDFSELIDVRSGTELARIHPKTDTFDAYASCSFGFAKDSKTLIAEYMRYNFVKPDGTVSSEYCAECTTRKDTICQGLLIDPPTIINRIKNKIADLNSIEKADPRYGINEKLKKLNK